ncbi:unnamed protein product [Brachionus calyciflorus]|uniref:Uncharacterized protein n=1 Tax=Brachionus calyciflorus TaxID=104777 RepID=A0A814DYT6_9BILA|nr:unnamed protein product [Brachionus calyciflorus]
MRKNSVSLFVVLLMVYESSLRTKADTLTVQIEEPKGSGKFVDKDLLDFIKQAEKNMSLETNQNSIVRKKALMVMGLTGTGKSTLVNYLNDVPLVGKRINRKLVIALKYAGFSLPGGFSIGHKAQSETLYPAVYSRNEDDFTYIDNPGFRDTRGLSIELANGFFRELVTKNVEQLKFLLLLSHEDLNQRGQQFRESMKGFQDFLGIFDNGDPITISKSIGIVVTRVENDGDSDEEMIASFKERLLQIIKNEKRDRNFENEIVEKVFTQIVNNNQIKLFSSPEREVDIGPNQKIEILRLIDDLDYLDKKQARIRVRVEQSYISKLLAYTQRSVKTFETLVQDTIEKSLIKYFTFKKSFLNNCNDASNLYTLIEKVQNMGLKSLDLNEYLASIDNEILSEKEKVDITSKKDVLLFMINFLPEVNRASVSLQRPWLNLELSKKFSLLNDELIEYCTRQFNEFQRDVQQKIKKNLLNYYNVEKFNAHDSSDAANIYLKLNKLYQTGTQINSLDKFLNELDTNLLNGEERESILKRKLLIENFLKLIPDVKRKNFSFDRIWLNNELTTQIVQLFDDLISFVENQFKDFESYLTSILTQNIKNYFRNQVNSSTNIQSIRNLETYLNNLMNSLTTESTFEKFYDQIGSLLLNDTEKVDIRRKKNQLDSFTNLVGNRQQKFAKEKNWISLSLNYEINSLIEEIKQYYTAREPTLTEDGIYTYTCYFGLMSDVLAKIHNSANTKNLKQIQIFATHSFEFDVNFLLNAEKYETNHPDLTVIAPNLVFPKKVTIDLTCKRIPAFPDNKPRANSGKGVGDAGENGKPGLPGFNAGYFKVFADKIVNEENMIFVSTGGQGGTGQQGGDGTEGKTGVDVLASEVDEHCTYNELSCNNILGQEIPIKGHMYRACDVNLLSECFLVRVDVHHDDAGMKKSSRYYQKNGGKGLAGGASGKPGKGGYPGYGGNAFLMTSNSFKTYNGLTGSNGNNGAPGNPGLGGKDGNGMRRAFFIQKMKELAAIFSLGIALAGNQHHMAPETEIIQSNSRGPSGVLTTELNEEGIQKASQSVLEFYERETDYFKFMNEVNLQFKNSKLIERVFCSKLLQSRYFQPTLEAFINRFYVLNQYESRHLVNDLKNELVDYYVKSKLTQRDDQIAFNYTYTAISSALYRLNSIDQTAIVVDLRKFLEMTIEQINNWKSLAKQDAREVYKRNYQNNLKSKINEANSLVTILTNDIEENDKNINRVLRNIIEEIKEMQKSAFRNDTILLEQKRELEKQVLIKKIMGVLKIGCQIMSFMGPEAKLAGSVIEGGLGVANMFLPDKFKLPEIKINSDISGAMSEVLEKISKYKEKKFQNINKELERLEKETEKPAPREKTLSERIDLLPDSVFKFELKKNYANYVKKDTNDPKRLAEADKQLDDAEVKLEREKKKLSNIQAGANGVLKVIDTVKVIMEVKGDFERGDQELEIMAQAIEDNAKNFHNLNKLEENINQFENTIVKNVQNLLADINKNLKGSSITSLEITRWKTKRILEEFRDTVMQSLNSFGNTSEIITTINRIDSSFSTMINIYSKIESYMEQNDFASYIADITKTEIAVGIPVKYQAKINELKKTIHSNIIKDRYQQAIEAFKYWSFPFFCQYTSDLTIYDTAHKEISNTDEMISKYADSLSNLLNKYRNYEAVLRPSIDNYIQSFSFENEYAFFKWSSVKYPIEVKRLLNGMKTTFQASLDGDNRKLFDAVKFCTIYLTIETRNTSKNQMIKELLKNYFVELTHSGISNYLYKNKKYTIESNFNSGEKLRLRYPYGSTDSNNANESFKKLSANNPILSPYTFWDIQLVPINKQNEYQLKNELNSLIGNNDELIVSLNGRGQYLVTGEYDISNNDQCTTFLKGSYMKKVFKKIE